MVSTEIIANYQNPASNVFLEKILSDNEIFYDLMNSADNNNNKYLFFCLLFSITIF